VVPRHIGGLSIHFTLAVELRTPGRHLGLKSVAGLGGPAVSAPVMGDHPITVLEMALNIFVQVLSSRCKSDSPAVGRARAHESCFQIAALVQKSFPLEGSTEPSVDITVDVEKFPAIVGADVDQDLMKVLALSQRPLAATAFTEPAPAAAWKTKPSWGVVSSSDHTINPDVERFGYKRADMTVEEIDSAQVVILSHPSEVADLIKRVIAATTP
jgi:hypothetical protein